MEHVQAILDGARPDNSPLFPVVWSEHRLDTLRRTVAGEIQGYAPVDGALSRFLLLCASGDFDAAEAGILDILRANAEALRSSGEVFISLLNALFVVQRLDLVGGLLRDRFGFAVDVNVAFSDNGLGAGILRWTISPDGGHQFVFDAGVLRTDATRNEILNFYWIFPLLAHYAGRGEQETGSILLNREDIGRKPGLAYCDFRPDFFLIPDAGFVASNGYHWSRHVLGEKQLAWADRRPVAFWRGATTGMKPSPAAWRALERVRLCELARSHEATGLFDVGLSNIVQLTDPDAIREIMESGLLLGRVPWEDWGQYRYLIDIDGNSSPYSNLVQRLLTGSPVLKVESPRGLMQWFYSELIPWHNYVPIAADMSDLLDKVRWLRCNDEFAQRIGQNGRALAERLTLEREMERSVPVISAAFRYFRAPGTYTLPFGMPPRPTGLQRDEVPGRPVAPGAGRDSRPPADRHHSVEMTMLARDAGLFARKRAIEANFAGPRDSAAEEEYLSLLGKINREYCGILDFRWPGVPSPLYMRCGSSDLANFGQMFLNQEYGFPLPVAPARILDLGAYAGYAAVYLSIRFPRAEIVSIEPSPANFQMLTLNTGAYGRVRRLNVAVWGHRSSLRIADTSGGDWGIRLAENDDPEAGIPGLSIVDILARVGWDRCDYLKCDIEGAEAGVFAESGTLIADMVQYCAVETHDAIDPDSSRMVKAAFSGEHFVNTRNGEFEVFVRRDAFQVSDRTAARVSLLRPEKGLRRLTLTNVREEGWAYSMFGGESCQLHPANVGQAPPELAAIVDLDGQTAFVSDVEVVNPHGFSVDFMVQVIRVADDAEIANARISVAAGDRQRWTVPLGSPAPGPYRVILRTVMAAGSRSNHQANANWIAPHFHG
nr:glycosyl transferase family 90 [uncultured Rhodopila sp.]